MIPDSFSYRETTTRLFHKNLYKFCLTFRRNILYVFYLSLILDCSLLLPSSWSRRRKGASAWIASSFWNYRSPNFWTIKYCFLHVVKLIFWKFAFIEYLETLTIYKWTTTWLHVQFSVSVSKMNIKASKTPKYNMYRYWNACSVEQYTQFVI